MTQFAERAPGRTTLAAAVEKPLATKPKAAHLFTLIIPQASLAHRRGTHRRLESSAQPTPTSSKGQPEFYICYKPRVTGFLFAIPKRRGQQRTQQDCVQRPRFHVPFSSLSSSRICSAPLPIFDKAVWVLGGVERRFEHCWVFWES